MVIRSTVRSNINVICKSSTCCTRFVFRILQAKFSLKTKEAKQSYALGQSIGKNMSQQGLDIDEIALSEGLKDD